MNPIDMYISGCGTSTCYIGCPLTDFSINKYQVNIGTLLTPSERNTLRNAIIPGRYEKFDVLFGTPYYIDTTYNSGNTIKITPYSTAFTNFWSGNTIVVSDYKEEPFGQPLEYYKISITGYIKGEL